MDFDFYAGKTRLGTLENLIAPAPLDYLVVAIPNKVDLRLLTPSEQAPQHAVFRQHARQPATRVIA